MTGDKKDSPPGGTIRKTTFLEKASRVAEFREREGRWPRCTGRDLDPDELILGRWFAAQRRSGKTQAMPEDRRTELNAIMPGWDAQRINTRANPRSARSTTPAPRPECRATDCERESYALGLCSKHYLKQLVPGKGPRGSHRKWTPEEDAVTLRTDLTYKEIAARLGRTRGAVSYRRRRLRNARVPTTQLPHRVLRLHDLRHPIREIAKLVGASPATAGFIIQAGDTARDWTEIDPHIRDLYDRHRSIDGIATAVGIRREIITWRIRLLGLTRPDIRPASREAEPPRPREIVTHGSAGYAAGCPCKVCAAAVRTQQTRLQDATLATATAHGQPWTATEDETVMDPDRALTDIARELGRSYRAISSRRTKLRGAQKHE